MSDANIGEIIGSGGGNPTVPAHGSHRDGQAPAVLGMLVLVRLALINSIGYCASTIVPLWAGDLGPRMGMPVWFGGAVASAQLVTAAIFNLATPFLFGTVAPARLGKAALILATAVFLLTLSSDLGIFMFGCIGGGACLGVVLNATNRIVAGSAEVQKGYSVFLISECLFSASMFYAAAQLVNYGGASRVFVTLPAATLLGALLLFSIPAASVRTIALARRGTAVFGMNAVLGLAAVLLFFSGQNSINVSTLKLAGTIAIGPQTASAVLACAIVFGVIGGIASRWLGERAGTLRPILVAILLLAVVVFAMTRTAHIALFCGGVLWLQTTTFFTVPYFFTMLARLDPSGRTASVAPAFLLLGVGIGPSLAAWVTRAFDIHALGPVAGIVLLGSAACAIGASRNRPALARG